MNQSRGFNLRRVVIIAVFVLAVGIALLFWAKDIIREVIVLPLSYLIWVLNLLIQMTPQLFFWMVLLVITVLIAYRGIVGRRKVYAEMPIGLSDLPSDRNVKGRVAYWVGKVNLMEMRRGTYFQNSFHIAVARLLIDQLAHRYRIPASQVEARLNDGSISVPEEIHDYILTSLHREDVIGLGFFARLWQSILDKLRSWLNQRGIVSQSAAADPRIARILQYMEEELEVLHDDVSQ